MTVEDDLALLQQDNAKRISVLHQMNVVLPDLRTFYIVRMLEELMGESLPFVRLETERVISKVLDGAEPAVARAHILAPMQNGRYTPGKS